MLVTLLGTMTEFILLPKADAPMVVTPSGIVTEVRPQFMNASVPILFTLLGMLTEVRPSQSMKAL